MAGVTAQNEANADIKAWEPNEIPINLLELPRKLNLRIGEFHKYWEIGIDKVLEEVKQGIPRAIDSMRLGKLFFLNVMRIDSGLAPTLEPIVEWNRNELIAAPWGNDFTPSLKKTVSPNQGWFYRMVDENWDVFAKRLVFWDPEHDLNVDKSRISVLNSLEHRKRVINAIKTLMAKTTEAETLAKKEKAAEAPAKKKTGKKGPPSMIAD